MSHEKVIKLLKSELAMKQYNLKEQSERLDSVMAKANSIQHIICCYTVEIASITLTIDKLECMSSVENHICIKCKMGLKEDWILCPKCGAC